MKKEQDKMTTDSRYVTNDSTRKVIDTNKKTPCPHCKKMFDEGHPAKCAARPVSCKACGAGPMQAYLMATVHLAKECVFILKPVIVPPPPPPPSPPPVCVPDICPTCFKSIPDRESMKVHLLCATCVAPKQRGILGLELGTSSLTVGRVREGGPAAVAGVKEGDGIVSIRGVPMRANEEVTAVMDSVYMGDEIPIEIRKPGTTNTKLVRLLINRPITDLTSTRNRVLRSVGGVENQKELEALLADEGKLLRMTRTCFDIVDTNKNGTLDRKEIRDLVFKISTAVGGAVAEMPPTSEEMDIVFNDIDADGSGAITFDEFAPMIRKMLTDTLQEIKAGTKEEQLKKIRTVSTISVAGPPSMLGMHARAESGSASPKRK